MILKKYKIIRILTHCTCELPECQCPEVRKTLYAVKYKDNGKVRVRKFETIEEREKYVSDYCDKL